MPSLGRENHKSSLQGIPQPSLDFWQIQLRQNALFRFQINGLGILHGRPFLIVSLGRFHRTSQLLVDEISKWQNEPNLVTPKQSLAKCRPTRMWVHAFMRLQRPKSRLFRKRTYRRMQSLRSSVVVPARMCEIDRLSYRLSRLFRSRTALNPCDAASRASSISAARCAAERNMLCWG